MRATFAITDAIIHVLLGEIAPDFLAEIGADPRAAADPGLRAATARITAWLEDLRCAPEAALEPPRLAEALRSAFVCAAGRGRIFVPVDPAETAWIDLSPVDLLVAETVRALAATLDAARGTSVAAGFDAHREATLARAFDFAERAADRARRAGRRGSR